MHEYMHCTALHCVHRVATCCNTMDAVNVEDGRGGAHLTHYQLNVRFAVALVLIKTEDGGRFSKNRKVQILLFDYFLTKCWNANKGQ